jgi:TrmH RNA methyltransferase
MTDKRPRPAAAKKAAQPRLRHQATEEETYHGLHACEALFAKRPDAIVRVYLTADVRQRFRRLVSFCSSSRRGYRVVEAENLDRISGTRHHEGIAILARAIPRWTMAELLTAVASNAMSGPFLYLDGVSNPHNLGSILRTAAHFGCSAVLGRAGDLPPLSSAAVRVAEGAAELVPVCDLTEPRVDLGKLREAGFRLVATSSHRGEPLAHSGLNRRCVIALGSEGTGISRLLESSADCTVCIPGTGAVESLNVAVACGVLLAEACREKAVPRTTKPPRTRP